MSEIEQLRQQVRELEEALEGAIWVKADYAQKVSLEFGLTKQQGAVVAILAQAGESCVSEQNIALALPRTIGRSSWEEDVCEAEPRCDGFSNTVILNIRRRLGMDAIENHRGFGYRLSPKLLSLVRAAAG